MYYINTYIYIYVYTHTHPDFLFVFSYTIYIKLILACIESGNGQFIGAVLASGCFDGPLNQTAVPEAKEPDASQRLDEQLPSVSKSARLVSELHSIHGLDGFGQIYMEQQAPFQPDSLQKTGMAIKAQGSATQGQPI